ncbi:MAG: hypothetical protein JRD68_15695, partial [Deltaproteobacteria bacterium]|nr:hypothetical protein [Deltaproteobacteria bacterium]
NTLNMRRRNKRLFTSEISPNRRTGRTRRIAIRATAAVIGLGLVVLLAATFLPGFFPFKRWGISMNAPSIRVLTVSGTDEYAGGGFTKNILADMIGPRLLKPNEPGTYCLKDQSGNDFFIATTLDRELQDWAVKTVSRVKAYLAALVVLEPATGNVLAMASSNNGGMEENYALQSSFPAASLFKIVTAAAVLEAKEMTCASILTYSGQRHTLYRKYLVPDFRNGQHKTTLEESFAKSINIVFGKLGAFTLGAGPLEDFAERFYFNRRINFEMPVEPSRFDSPGSDAFLLAEKASGFNIETRISPLHAAMIAGAAANEGVLMEPSLIKEAFDQNNTIYYRSRPTAIGTVMNRRLVPELKEMMKTAISRGTARPSFRDLRYHRTLSRLKLGGKTGTINDEHKRKVDWFAAFAEWPETGEEIALAVLVVHNRDVLGVRARTVGREAILHYFNPRIKTAKGFKTAHRRAR